MRPGRSWACMEQSHALIRYSVHAYIANVVMSCSVASMQTHRLRCSDKRFCATGHLHWLIGRHGQSQMHTAARWQQDCLRHGLERISMLRSAPNKHSSEGDMMLLVTSRRRLQRTRAPAAVRRAGEAWRAVWPGGPVSIRGPGGPGQLWGPGRARGHRRFEQPGAPVACERRMLMSQRGPRSVQNPPAASGDLRD